MTSSMPGLTVFPVSATLQWLGDHFKLYVFFLRESLEEFFEPSLLKFCTVGIAGTIAFKWAQISGTRNFWAACSSY